MLNRLHVQNFTVFADAMFEFSPGLNVIVGTNGTGKSHVLKLAYAAQVVYAGAPREVPNVYAPTEESTDLLVAVSILSRLDEIFLPNGLKHLVRRPNSPAAGPPKRAHVRATFGKSAVDSLAFDIASDAPRNNSVAMPKPATIGEPAQRPIFIPAKEMLSLMPSIIGLSEKFTPLLDSTYTDLARALVGPLLKTPPPYVQTVLDSLGKVMQGTIQSENGRFYLLPAHGERLEITLVAEGYRKLGTLAYLLANGSLNPETTLYWDEPEANLNPALLREVARLLTQLARQGFQIILATHSLFLLKELHILAQPPGTAVRYFGLSALPDGPTTVSAAPNLELLPDIVALDAELDQSDRFQNVLDQEDDQ